MAEMIVNNPNIVIDAQSRGKSRSRWRSSTRTRSKAEAALIRRVRQLARQVAQVACSSTWAEDCLYRGVDYVPDFRCACPRCRKDFRKRLHPRAARESSYSQDCQVEVDEDPEFAEEFARLRNTQDRIGSVVIGKSDARRSSRRPAE